MSEADRSPMLPVAGTLNAAGIFDPVLSGALEPYSIIPVPLSAAIAFETFVDLQLGVGFHHRAGDDTVSVTMPHSVAVRLLESARLRAAEVVPAMSETPSDAGRRVWSQSVREIRHVIHCIEQVLLAEMPGFSVVGHFNPNVEIACDGTQGSDVAPTCRQR